MNIVDQTTWITVERMRQHLGISKGLAYKIATSGDLETVKIGRSLRINEDSLRRWLDSVRYSKDQGGGEMH